ncbi:MAG: T9SS type A sorting domain-containing protein [Bacteroidota bacterium]|nr:T9SS type A sorting domain-containing protein [Bacteroidota bacterium]
MRKIYLTTFILFGLIVQIYSQQYAKIPIDTNYYWRQISTGGYQYQIRYTKDTLIAGKTFNKYSQFGMSIGTTTCQTFIRHCYLRQDTLAKKVSILDNNFVERPLYNFSKAVGDTMLVYDKISGNNVIYYVAHDYGTILEINHNGNPRWIEEGVGALTEGLFGPNSANDSIRELLICFGKVHPFTPIEYGTWINWSHNCYIINSLKNNSLENFIGIEVFPNPTSEILNIEIDNLNVTSSKVQIINSLGQKVREEKIDYPKSQINVSQLLTGIYTLKIFTENSYKAFKITKE